MKTAGAATGSAGKISLPLKVRDRIFRDILNGVWKNDNLLPGTAELAQRYHVGFCSVVEAVRMLGEEGIIIRHTGRRARVVGDARRCRQVGIVVDDAVKQLFPFNYTCASTTWLKFNAMQLALIHAGYAALSMPPDLEFGRYLPHLDAAVVLRDTDGQWRFDPRDGNLPAVYCFNQRPEILPEWCNYLDYEASMERAATTLIARGAKDICAVTFLHRKKNFDAFRRIIEKYPQLSFRQIEVECLVDKEKVRLLARALLRDARPPCGFLVIGDMLGWLLVEEALGRKLVLKKDISVIGTAGLPESRHMDPALSVIEVPFNEQAGIAVRQLGCLLRGNPDAAEQLKRVKIEAKLILRDT